MSFSLNGRLSSLLVVFAATLVGVTGLTPEPAEATSSARCASKQMRAVGNDLRCRASDEIRLIRGRASRADRCDQSLERIADRLGSSRHACDVADTEQTAALNSCVVRALAEHIGTNGDASGARDAIRNCGYQPLTSLYPHKGADMKEILEDVGSLDVATNKAKNAMVVFHLDGCSPCEGTLGSMEYERAQADSVLVKTGIHPLQILVQAENVPSYDPSHVYCAKHTDCVAQSVEYLSVSVPAIQTDNLRGFPEIHYYSNEGVEPFYSPRQAVSDQPCGIAVRADVPLACTSTTPDNCSASRNAVSNWVCGLVTGNIPGEDECETEWWKSQSACYDVPPGE